MHIEWYVRRFGIIQKNEYKEHYDFYRFTEFMSVEWYVRHPERLSKHLLTTTNSTLTVAQIYGWNHDNLLQSAIDIDNKYSDSFSGIELNIWCPSPKIMSCEAGSGMLKCRPKTLQIIKKISESIKKPFSIKTRRGLTEDDTEEQFNFIIDAAPYCTMITIHGRTYKQSHNGDVDRKYILRIKKELTKRGLNHVKVIWNGGLKSATDWLWYLWSDGIDGIMLGQAAMCNPWSLVSYTPKIKEIYQLTLDHLHLNLANEFYFNEITSFDKKNNLLIQPTAKQLEDLAKKLKIEASHLKNGTLFWSLENIYFGMLIEWSLVMNSKELSLLSLIILHYYQLFIHIFNSHCHENKF